MTREPSDSTKPKDGGGDQVSFGSSGRALATNLSAPAPPLGGAETPITPKVRDFGRVCYVPTAEERAAVDDLALKIPRATRRKVEALFKSWGHRDWNDWIEAVAAEVISEIDDQSYIEMDTLNSLLPEWTYNLAENLRVFGQYDDAALPRDVLELARLAEGKDVVVVGAGPSVARRGHLARLAAHREDHALFVIATDKMLMPCLNAGIMPDLVGGVDSNPIVARFYDDAPLRGMRLALSVTTHPDVLRAALAEGARVHLSVPYIDPQHAPNVLYFMYNLFAGRYSAVNSCGNTGSHCWALAQLAGARRIALVGFDMGYYKDERLLETAYGRAIAEKCGGDADKIGKFFTHYVHECWGRREKYLTDVVFRGYAKTFLDLLRLTPSPPTFNCTEGGILCGAFGGEKHPLSCITLDEFLGGAR